MGTTPNRAIPYPEPSDLVTNGAAALKALAEKIDALLGPDAECRASLAAQVTLVAGTPTVLALNTEVYDPTGMHSTSGDTSRMTIAVAGSYFVRGVVEHTSATGAIQTRVHVNGAPPLGMLNADVAAGGSGAGRSPVVVDVLQLAPGDYVQLAAYSQNGGPVTVNSSLTVKLLP